MATILFDVDGVLADFIFSFTTMLSYMTGISSSCTEMMTYDWDFKNSPYTADDLNAGWEMLKRDPTWWTRLTPLINSSTWARIEQLCHKHHVVFGTSRPSYFNAQKQTQAWLLNHGISTPSVVITKRKGELAHVLGAAYAIDDKPENAVCIHWLADSPQCKVFLREWDYTRCAAAIMPPKISRVSGVEEFLNRIEEEEV